MKSYLDRLAFPSMDGRSLEERVVLLTDFSHKLLNALRYALVSAIETKDLSENQALSICGVELKRGEIIGSRVVLTTQSKGGKELKRTTIGGGEISLVYGGKVCGRITAASGALQIKAENGYQINIEADDVSIGRAGQPLKLLGNVTINGVSVGAESQTIEEGGASDGI